MPEDWKKEQPEFARYLETSFCNRAERAGIRCKPCFDSICTVKSPREQRLYKGFGVHDTIAITAKKDGGFRVESDIEVPFSVDPLKGTGGVMDKMQKNKVILTMALGPKIPKGMQGPWFHPHHSPNRLPEVAALHVHIAGEAKTYQEAGQMAKSMWKIVDAERLTKLLE